jgi:hypothetical protein
MESWALDTTAGAVESKAGSTVTPVAGGAAGESQQDSGQQLVGANIRDCGNKFFHLNLPYLNNVNE